MYEIQILDIAARLVQNAVKFSNDKKTIEILFLSAGNEFVMQVKDKGIGFNDSQLSTITQAFCQIDRDKLEQQGSGAGLAIASAFVHFHSGRLEFANNPDGGAKVSMVIPIIA